MISRRKIKVFPLKEVGFGARQQKQRKATLGQMELVSVPAQGLSLHPGMAAAMCVCPYTLSVSVQLPRAMTWLLFLLQDNLQIYLKSTQGPIEVYLCPEEVQEPDSPSEEPLPSTSTLCPSPDSAQPSSSTDPSIMEPTASSGRALVQRDRRSGEQPALVFSSTSMLKISCCIQQLEMQSSYPTHVHCTSCFIKPR